MLLILMTYAAHPDDTAAHPDDTGWAPLEQEQCKPHQELENRKRKRRSHVIIPSTCALHGLLQHPI